MEICFATHNQHKSAEIARLVTGGISIVDLTALGLQATIEETGSLLEENASIKSNYVFKRFGIPCFADDTGLEVKSLNGEPGVYSARYAGPQRDALANMNLLLERLQAHQDRTAQFRTVISYIDGNGVESLFEGVVAGTITKEPSGSEGFGYDPIFIPVQYNQTFAEMSTDQKNQISHRSIAFRKLISHLNAL